MEDDLRSGRLVTPIALPLRMPGGYYLAYAPDRPPSSRMLAFEAWVVGVAAAQVPTENESGRVG